MRLRRAPPFLYLFCPSLLFQSICCADSLRGATFATVNSSTTIARSRDDDCLYIPQAKLTVPLHVYSASHHVVIHVGSPEPQRQTLILDTGSRYTAFPCDPWCRNCGRHHSQPFNGTKSTTLKNIEFPDCAFATKRDFQYPGNSCFFNQSYLEGSSWTAIETEDLLGLGTWDYEKERRGEYFPYLAMPFVFGCQISVKGHFAKQYADGVLGLARPLDKNSFLSSLVQAKAVERGAFATCLSRQGGTLSLGGSGLTRQDSNTQYHVEPMAFANLVPQDHGLYSIQIVNVSVGEICITCPDTARGSRERELRKRSFQAFHADKKVLLDTGTTDTFFPKQAYPVFAAAWASLTGFEMTLGTRRYTYHEYLRIPDITMVFEPMATLVIPASAYMEGVPLHTNSSVLESVRPWTGTKNLTMRLYLEEQSGAVLGANAMYNYDILYDVQDKRVGFARAQC